MATAIRGSAIELLDTGSMATRVVAGEEVLLKFARFWPQHPNVCTSLLCPGHRLNDNWLLTDAFQQTSRTGQR